METQINENNNIIIHTVPQHVCQPFYRLFLFQLQIIKFAYTTMYLQQLFFQIKVIKYEHIFLYVLELKKLSLFSWDILILLVYKVTNF